MGVYTDIKRSILSYCNKAITRHTLTGFESFDFDTHASINELPAHDLIGISDYAVTNLGEQYSVTCMILISTMSDDAMLVRLTPAIDAIFGELQPGQINPYLDIVDSNGQSRGIMKVMGPVEVTPVGASKSRPVQGVMVNFSVGYSTQP